MKSSMDGKGSLWKHGCNKEPLFKSVCLYFAGLLLVARGDGGARRDLPVSVHGGHGRSVGRPAAGLLGQFPPLSAAQQLPPN